MVGGLFAFFHVVWITFIPFLELRASIPIGLGLIGKSAIMSIALVAIITNIILGIILFFIVEWIIKVFTKIDFIKKIYDNTIIKIQKKVHPYIHRYGTIGLAIFIGIPLPGSGVYSGVIAAKILGFEFKDYFIAMCIGVVIAGLIVAIVSFTGAAALSIFIKG
jgi:uncharacterized membrane protein